jgi:hypothetical protein
MTVLSAATVATKRPIAAGGRTVIMSEIGDEALVTEIVRRVKNGAFSEELLEKLEIEAGRGVEDLDDLQDASDWWRRGDRREALHYLELALGRDFLGLGDLRPEDLG